MLLTGPTGVVPALEEFERAARGLDPVFANSPLLPEVRELEGKYPTAGSRSSRSTAQAGVSSTAGRRSS